MNTRITAKLFIILLIFTCLLVVSCRDNSAENVLKSYIDLLLRGYKTQAYDHLSIKIKNKISRNEFIEASSIYQGILKDFFIIDVKFSESLATIRYEILVIDAIGLQEKLKSTATLRNEKGKWKILDPGF